jgi:hypothetical protein
MPVIALEYLKGEGSLKGKGVRTRLTEMRPVPLQSRHSTLWPGGSG